jgi:Holliday junction DNA helicase RuvA
MFEFMKGILKDKDPQKAVVEVNSIGYKLVIPLSTYSKLPNLETPVCFYLSQVIREDSNTLFGFLDTEERNLFEKLITISGIGPKTAVAIIGHIDMNTFQRAINSNDVRLLSKIPGIGKKTAERLVIEMRDKFKGSKKDSSMILSSGVDLVSDAISALINLGYNPLIAQKALDKVFEEKKEETDLGRIITYALQKI